MVGRVARHHLRAAGLHVDVGRPVDRGIVLLGHEQLAGLAIERVAEAVAVEVDQNLAHLTVDLVVGEDHLVDAVVVPLVVRRHLVDPLGHAGLRIAGEDGHRPAIVAGTLRRVPGPGIAGAVVHQIQLRIVRHPAPGGAAAQLPLLAFPGGGAGILADRLAQMGRGRGIDQGLIVGPGRIATPHHLAVVDVVGGDVALDAELAARDADQHLVADHHRRAGPGLALLGSPLDTVQTTSPVCASSATKVVSA